ncbi:MAG: hypothetical protein ABIQ86_07900 [Steroidobacteraceae bacterium]
MSNSKFLLASAALAAVLAAGLAGCKQAPDSAESRAALVPAGTLDRNRLLAVESEPGSWLTSGRDFGKTHYSPLELINQQNVDHVISIARQAYAEQQKGATAAAAPALNEGHR